MSRERIIKNRQEIEGANPLLICVLKELLRRFYLNLPGITGVKADNGFTVKQDISAY